MNKFLKSYFISFIFSCFLLFGMLFYFGFTFDLVKEYYFQVLFQFMESFLFWIFLTIPIITFRVVRYLFQSYKNHGKMTFLRRFSFSIILPVGLFFSLFNLSQWYTKNENFNYQWISEIENKTGQATDLFTEDNKQRGVHVFGRLDSINLQPLIKNNVEWITMVPFGDQEDYDSPEVRYHHSKRKTLLDIDSIWSKKIQAAHSYDLKVFLKPHVWIFSPSNGTWRSDIFPSNETNWETWKKSYREFTLLYAKIAEKNNVEMFCIGTEFTRLAIEKPDFWKNLIEEVRSIYSGKITYAANWYEEFEQITFWDKLDFIGIQAYFPLVKNTNPSVKQISKGWKKHLSSIERIHKKFAKKILFTELGYKSTTDSAIEPWSWIDYSSNLYKPVSTETQANCYQAFFNTVWKKEWFAGVHFWQWHTSEEDGGKDNLDFTPRSKPAENIIAKGFGGK
ncbi:MAG: hypothetical protein AB8F94_29800 [Saprospiraceae bacterium]